MQKKKSVLCITNGIDTFLFVNATGVTFAEYIRRRKLTKAAYDLRSGDDTVIDVDVKYG